MKVNLHTHSNKSDGKLSPTDLVNILHKNGVETFALTDHDSVAGILEAKQIADKLGMKMINGIEISCDISSLNLPFVNERSGVHLLGLKFDLDIIQKIYNTMKMDKIERIKQLIFSLKSDGYKIELHCQVEKKTQVAQSLVENGYAKDIQEAFNQIINRYYDIHLDLMTVEKAIQVIHKSNGKAIWAHPFDIMDFVNKKRINQDKVELLAIELKKLALDGIETYYSPYNNKQINFLKRIQIEYGFICSAGTDYHALPSQNKTYLDMDENILMEVIK